MKRTYEKPELNVTSIEETDVITLSSTTDTLSNFNSNTFSSVISY